MKIDMMRGNTKYWNFQRSKMIWSLWGVGIFAVICVIATIMHNMLPLVNLDQQVELHQGQSVRIKQTPFTIGVKEFHKATCPVHSACDSPSAGIDWILMNGGVTETRLVTSYQGSEFTDGYGYRVKIVDTDNSSYVKFIVTKDISNTSN